MAREVADCSIMNSSILWCSGLAVISVMVGALGYLASRFGAFTIRMLIRPGSTILFFIHCGAMPGKFSMLEALPSISPRSTEITRFWS